MVVFANCLKILLFARFVKEKTAKGINISRGKEVKKMGGKKIEARNDTFLKKRERERKEYTKKEKSTFNFTYF